MFFLSFGFEEAQGFMLKEVPLVCSVRLETSIWARHCHTAEPVVQHAHAPNAMFVTAVIGCVFSCHRCRTVSTRIVQTVRREPFSWTRHFHAYAQQPRALKKHVLLHGVSSEAEPCLAQLRRVSVSVMLKSLGPRKTCEFPSAWRHTEARRSAAVQEDLPDRRSTRSSSGQQCPEVLFTATA